MRNNTKRILPRLPVVGGLAALGFLLFVPDTAQAQTQPKQFHACYVPSSGVVYRIKEPGLKDECTGKKHVEFSWAQLFAANDGKVGIGTDEPAATLDVAGDIHASGILKLGNTMVFNGLTNTITSGTDEDIAILPGGTGKVGIGTTSPSEKLDVNGTVNANAFVGDGSGLTGIVSSYTETDPIYSASVAVGIGASQLTNWNTAYGWGNHASAGYLASYTETDPVFGASVASGISATDIGSWNTAYGWGNHASAGYLTSYTETDPVFGASVAAGITASQLTNWNTAYGWGDHSAAGY